MTLALSAGLYSTQIIEEPTAVCEFCNCLEFADAIVEGSTCRDCGCYGKACTFCFAFKNVLLCNECREVLWQA